MKLFFDLFDITKWGLSITLFALSFLLFSCQNNKSRSDIKADGLNVASGFQAIPVDESGIDFVNRLEAAKILPFYMYINVFNGGGIAIGDVNNDGLEDVYLTGNMVTNKLYLNKGDFKFEEVTQSARVGLEDKWSTGATMTDVNNDGWLDIYVCAAYHEDAEKRENVLFLNMKDGTFKDFTDFAQIGDPNYSICASFFDYDRDGDNDLFVGNHGGTRPKATQEGIDLWKNPKIETSDRLYRNDGNMKFTDVTESAGILNFGWTLGVIAMDFNNDGWTDIYVAVDHDQPDALFINQKDGTFKNDIKAHFAHTSFSSMGIDVGDVNNDGFLDLFALDMLSKDNYREKTNMGSMDVKSFEDMLSQGYHYQSMRNVLQLNRGNGHFSDVGQMSGVSRTEWSWAALLMDANNDGHEDLFITNGFYKDILNKDWGKEFRKKYAKTRGKKSDLVKLYSEEIDFLESSPYKNELYINNGDIGFTESATDYGLDHNGFSSGAAYADLDNDGDLDLIVCNIDEPVSLYRNQITPGGNQNFVSFKLKDYIASDPQGTLLTISWNGLKKSKIFLRSRGYASCMGELIHFGLGASDKIDGVDIVWPNGKKQSLINPEVNSIIEISYQPEGENSPKELVQTTFKLKEESKVFLHKENAFDDYAVQVLLPHQMSKFGPIMSKGDINGDGLEDIYFGGAADQPGKLLTQNKNGTFSESRQPALAADNSHEDMGSVLFDGDGDGDLDLLVVSGGNEKPESNAIYQDRYYKNENGRLKRVKGALPENVISGGRVVSGDVDKDGDLDVLIAGRQVPHQYPEPTNSTLLINNGAGVFTNGSERIPGLKELGMCSDVVFSDVDMNGELDLIAVGEWMSIHVFLQKEGIFSDASSELGLENTTGWWNRITSCDLNNDGREDYVLGNLGENYKYRVKDDKSVHIYGKDFDGNGSHDIVLGYYLDDETLYPVRGRQCSSEQIPEIAQKFPTYDAYGRASLEDVYGEQLNDAIHYEAEIFSSIVLINSPSGLEIKKLPSMAQIAPVFGIACEDFTGDGHTDILLAGNLYVSEVETGRADAGMGLLLEGDGNNNFEPVPAIESGFSALGDVRDIIRVETSNGSVVVVGRNNDKGLIFEQKENGL